MRKLVQIIGFASLLLSLVSCSSGSSSGIQTVQAQSGYSNASLTGTYSVSFMCQGCQISAGNTLNQSFAIGTIQLNGAGGITGGTLSVMPGFSLASTCVESVSGTYSLQSTALGVASLSLSSTGAGCSATTTIPLSLTAAGQGTSILFQGTLFTELIYSGTAIKQ
jgi:hypothetical protein